MKQLDPKVIWLFFLQSFSGIILLIMPFFFAYIFAFRHIFTNDRLVEPLIPAIILFLFNWWWVLVIILLIIQYIFAYLTYYFYRYELREDGFRKEHGIIWKKYVTIPYERIQNVDIYRGVWARILGLSDIQIQTAGMSTTVSSYGAGSEGRLPGLSKEDAESMRDELVKRARGHKGGGT